jgi:hypothetical protein
MKNENFETVYYKKSEASPLAYFRLSFIFIFNKVFVLSSKQQSLKNRSN